MGGDILPQMLVCKCVAGTLFQVAFEGFGFLLLLKGEVGDDFPRFVFVGVRRFSGVVFAEAGFGFAGGEANVAAAWVG